MPIARICPLTFVIVLSALCLLVPNVDSRRVQATENRLLADDLGEMLAADGDARIAAGHPRRPDSFRTVDELNQYLAEMRQYYSMLGRPR